MRSDGGRLPRLVARLALRQLPPEIENDPTCDATGTQIGKHVVDLLQFADFARHANEAAGREVEGFEAPWVNQDGKSYTELRIAEDWSAAIIRK